jgi:hypothetical protein
MGYESKLKEVVLAEIMVVECRSMRRHINEDRLPFARQRYKKIFEPPIVPQLLT